MANQKKSREFLQRISILQRKTDRITKIHSDLIEIIIMLAVIAGIIYAIFLAISFVIDWSIDTVANTINNVGWKYGIPFATIPFLFIALNEKISMHIKKYPTKLPPWKCAILGFLIGIPFIFITELAEASVFVFSILFGCFDGWIVPKGIKFTKI